MYLHVVVLAERDLVVALRMAPAWFLVELGLWIEPAWLLNSYLDVGVLVPRELVVVARKMPPALLLSSYLDLEGLDGLVSFPGGGWIAAAAPSLINLDGFGSCNISHFHSSGK